MCPPGTRNHQSSHKIGNQVLPAPAVLILHPFLSGNRGYLKSQKTSSLQDTMVTTTIVQSLLCTPGTKLRALYFLYTFSILGITMPTSTVVSGQTNFFYNVTRDAQDGWKFTDRLICHAQLETGKDQQTFLRGNPITKGEGLNIIFFPAGDKL